MKLAPLTIGTIGASACALLLLALVGVASVSVSGCGNDFDGLFVNPSGTNAPDGGGVVSPEGDSSSSSSSGGSIDAASDGTAPDGGLACGAPTPTCLAKGTTDGSKDVTNKCEGCGCQCTPDACPKNAETCESTCSKGANCTFKCDVQDECSLKTNGVGTRALLTCEGDVECKAKCEAGSSCTLDCKNTKTGTDACSLECVAGAVCFINCRGKTPGTACVFACPGGAQAQALCSNGTVTCNPADCPPP